MSLAPSPLGLLTLTAAAASLAPPARAGAPPPVPALFGCPLADAGDGAPDAKMDTQAPGAAAWRPPRGWSRTPGPPGTWSVAAPPSWRVTRHPRGLRLEGPRGRVRLEATLSPPPLSPAQVRAAQEHTRLGPAFTGPACETRLSALLGAATGASAPLVASYGRPLGERRRTVAAFFATPDGVLAVRVTARWGRREPGAPWATLRRLLGGVRVGLTRPPAARDHGGPRAGAPGQIPAGARS